MQLSSVKIKFVTFTNILLAYAIMGAIKEGIDIH